MFVRDNFIASMFLSLFSILVLDLQAVFFSLLSTDIHLNPLPYLSSDDEVLINCDENIANNKNCDKFVNHETCQYSSLLIACSCEVQG